MSSGLIIFLVICAAVLVLVALGTRQAQRSRAAIRQWAAEHGWQYTRKDQALVKRWRSEPISGGGIVTDVLRKHFPEGPAVSFQHAYHRGPNTGLTTSHIVALDTGIQLPTTRIREPGSSNDARRGNSVLTADDPEFNRVWTVLAEFDTNTEELRALFSPAVREPLVGAYSVLKHSGINFDGTHIILIMVGEQDLARIEPATSLLRTLSRRVSRANT